MPEVVHKETSYKLKVLASADQIQKRVRELARQISDDFSGQLIMLSVGVLEDGFMFMADFVRALEGQVVCQFLKTYVTQHAREGGPALEIFFRPELDVTNQHVLLVQGVVQTGITTEFLIRHLISRGAASVRMATFVDRSTDRRVLLRADYFGYLLDDSYVVGYGWGTPSSGAIFHIWPCWRGNRHLTRAFDKTADTLIRFQSYCNARISWRPHSPAGGAFPGPALPGLIANPRALVLKGRKGTFVAENEYNRSR